MAASSWTIVIVTEQSPPPLPWSDAPTVPSAPEVDEELGLREARGRLVPLLLPLPLPLPRKPKPKGAPAIAPPFADDADTGAEADADAEEGWEETGDSSILEEATDEECRVVAVDGLDRVRPGGGGAGAEDKEDENG